MKFTMNSFLDFINPFRQLRRDRLEWVSKLTLPKCPGGCKYNVQSPLTQIHPLLDQYLTMDEARKLLLESGWARELIDPISGKVYHYQYMNSYKLTKMFGEYLMKHPEMLPTNPKWMLYYCNVRW